MNSESMVLKAFERTNFAMMRNGFSSVELLMAPQIKHAMEKLAAKLTMSFRLIGKSIYIGMNTKLMVLKLLSSKEGCGAMLT